MTAPLRVLVIEDNDLLRELLGISLERRGRFQVVGTAKDAKTGIALADDTSPQVILLDLLMPILSGFDALPLLRRAAPESHIIAVSMLEGPTVMQSVLARGGDGFIDKGIEGDELEERVWDFCMGPTITLADLARAAEPVPAAATKTLNARPR